MAKYYVNARTGKRGKRKPPAYCPHGVPAGSGRCAIDDCWNAQPFTEAEMERRRRRPILRIPLLRKIVDDAAEEIKRERAKTRRRRTKAEQKRKPKPEPKPLTGRAPRALDGEIV